MTRTLERLTLAGSLTLTATLMLTAAARGATSPEARAEARLDLLQSRIDALQRRLAVYESVITPNAGGGTTLKAPLTVTDGAGKPLFIAKENPRSFDLYDAAGNVAVLGSALGTASFVKVMNPAMNRVAVLAAETDDALLTFRDGADSKSDRMKLALASDGIPAILLYNDKHIYVMQITTGVKGAGLIQTDNAAGDVRVEIGTGDNDVGVVKAGPAGQCSAPMGPIAPTCLLGHKK